MENIVEAEPDKCQNDQIKYRLFLKEGIIPDQSGCMQDLHQSLTSGFWYSL